MLKSRKSITAGVTTLIAIAALAGANTVASSDKPTNTPLHTSDSARKTADQLPSSTDTPAPVAAPPATPLSTSEAGSVTASNGGDTPMDITINGKTHTVDSGQSTTVPLDTNDTSVTMSQSSNSDTDQKTRQKTKVRIKGSSDVNIQSRTDTSVKQR